MAGIWAGGEKGALSGYFLKACEKAGEEPSDCPGFKDSETGFSCCLYPP